MKKMYMIYNGGSGNRGCEAIIRGSKMILDKYNNIVFTNNRKEDIKSGLADVIECKEIKANKNKLIELFRYILCGFSYKFGTGYIQVKILFSNIWENIKNDPYIVIGGDVYCYGVPYKYYYINKVLKDNPKILWGCSIEPDSIDDKMKRDLLDYDLIYARESITYDGLIKNGINKNTKLFPDPAFLMNKICLPLPPGFKENNTIGINISPLIMAYVSDKEMILKNYIKLIEFIMENTDCNVALIPHVIWEGNDDRKPLMELYRHFEKTKRVIMINAESAEKMKGYISRCRFMIAARTHASIAAYSTCVPTLVVGYSVKAKGIAKDIFGDYRHYVIPVQLMKKEDDLTKAFMYLWDREMIIKKHLDDFIPGYCQKVYGIRKELDKILD